MSTVNEVMKKDNLANTFVLPLLKINKTSFNVDNFINCYLSEDNNVVVLVKNSQEVQTIAYTIPEYVTDYDREDGVTVIIYRLPEQFLSDVIKFKKGKYSEFSKVAKDTIIKYSGLAYKIPMSGDREKTHERLRAFDLEDETLREHVEKKIGEKLPKGVELLSSPDEDEFIKI